MKKLILLLTMFCLSFIVVAESPPILKIDNQGVTIGYADFNQAPNVMVSESIIFVGVAISTGGICIDGELLQNICNSPIDAINNKSKFQLKEGRDVIYSISANHKVIELNTNPLVIDFDFAFNKLLEQSCHFNTTI